MFFYTVPRLVSDNEMFYSVCILTITWSTSKQCTAEIKLWETVPATLGVLSALGCLLLGNPAAGSSTPGENSMWGGAEAANNHKHNYSGEIWPTAPGKFVNDCNPNCQLVYIPMKTWTSKHSWILGTQKLFHDKWLTPVKNAWCTLGTQWNIGCYYISPLGSGTSASVRLIVDVPAELQSSVKAWSIDGPSHFSWSS